MEWTAKQRREAGCRMCGECIGASHHWIEDCGFIPGDFHTHICKHCEVKGEFCTNCTGLGLIDDIDWVEHHANQSGQLCDVCDGEGVIPLGTTKPEMN